MKFLYTTKNKSIL